MSELEQLIKKISKGENLTFPESKEIFLNIMSGKMKENSIHDFLVNLSIKGETADEIAGGVYVLREKALKVKTTEEIIDTCGTGGDGKNTLNISTASSLLLASMGIKVAKHGNKALSSKCGSADVLERLKININVQADGSYATRRGVVCAILTADCIPLFLTDQFGTRVCVLHVGWRGLAAGIIEQALSVMHIETKRLIAWIGPGIGPDAFIVNYDAWKVLTVDGSLHRDAFIKYGNRWLANLGQMVEERLELAGVSNLHSSRVCTFKDPTHWFSYRRDGSCGRMASLIWMT